jgi:hypothetical protein
MSKQVSPRGNAGSVSFQLVMIPTGPPPANVCMQWQGTDYFDAFSVK